MPDKIISKEENREIPVLHALPPNLGPVRFLSRGRGSGLVRPVYGNAEFYILPGASVISLDEKRKQYSKLLKLNKTQTKRFEQKTDQLKKTNIQQDIVETLSAHYAFTGQAIDKQLLQGLRDKLKFDVSDGGGPDPADTNNLNANQGGIAA